MALFEGNVPQIVISASPPISSICPQQPALLARIVDFQFPPNPLEVVGLLSLAGGAPAF